MARHPLAIPGRTASVPFGGKIGPVSTDRNVAQVTSAPSPDNGRGENRTQAFTYFTKPAGASDILYNGDRMWVRIVLTLETAGPVAVGQQSKLSPELSGKGQLLPTGRQREFTIAKGTRLYISSPSVNRVAVTIEPLPWLEQIVGLVHSVADRIATVIGRSK